MNRPARISRQATKGIARRPHLNILNPYVSLLEMGLVIVFRRKNRDSATSTPYPAGECTNPFRLEVTDMAAISGSIRTHTRTYAIVTTLVIAEGLIWPRHFVPVLWPGGPEGPGH